MTDSTRRDFMKTTAIGAAALLASPSRVLGANDRVRVGMIGVGARGQDLLKQLLALPNAQLVAIADVYGRRRDGRAGGRQRPLLRKDDDLVHP